MVKSLLQPQVLRCTTIEEAMEGKAEVSTEKVEQNAMLNGQEVLTLKA